MTKQSKKKKKTLYYLDRKTAKIPALSSGNANKHKFLTDKNALPEKELLEKATAIKRFQY